MFFGASCPKALQLDISAAPAQPTFADIPVIHYAFPYVEAAAKAGLIQGQGAGTFGNGQNLSRQDMAIIFVRALGIDITGKAADLKFSDADSIADYAKDAVGAAVELGLIVGYENGAFSPKGSATREQVASVAIKFLSEVQKNPAPNPTPPNPEKPEPVEPAPVPTPNIPAPSVPSTGGGKVYAVDTSSNVSVPSSVLELRVPRMGQPAVSFTSADTLVITYQEDLDSNSIPALNDFVILDADDPQASPLPLQEVRVEGTKVRLKLSQAVNYLARIQINYQSDNAIISGTGKVSPQISEVVTYDPGNRNPIVVQEITDQTGTAGGTKISINPAAHFSDPDGDILTFTVTSTDGNIASAAVDGKIYIKPVSVGAASITITANDGKGGTIQRTFTITVEADPVAVAVIATEQLSAEDKDFSRTENLTPVNQALQSAQMLVSAVADATRKDEFQLRLNAVQSFLTTAVQATGKVTALENATADTKNLLPGKADRVLAGTAFAEINYTGLNSATQVSLTNRVNTSAALMNTADTLKMNVESLEAAVADTKDLSAAAADRLTADTAAALISYTNVTTGTKDAVIGRVNAAVAALTAADTAEALVIALENAVAAGKDLTAGTADRIAAENALAAISYAGTNTATHTSLSARAVIAGLKIPVLVNQPPVVQNMITPVMVPIVLGDRIINLANVFSDPDNDAMTYTAVSSDPGKATVTVNGTDLTITPLLNGSTVVRVTANDGKGGTNYTEFNVTLAESMPPILTGFASPLMVEFSFIDDANWRSKITAIEWDNQPITPTYNLSIPGRIMIPWMGMIIPGTQYKFKVKATGYRDAEIMVMI
ncbi:S-layer homology domain-containing protein [Paenibacillus sp. FJAT-26967]|uniref:S-layer homology domain-containing protein n=1 Tax=Paenibacillus sp. FJAT-26967 TaxID=1729690 RepID=UPI00083827FE|nr:S-layer homology domain-containing protein [Paenibacillus sp. FJAT-26967]